MRIRQLVLLCFTGVLSGLTAVGQQPTPPIGTSPDVTMWQGDFLHTGLNAQETVLTPAFVGTPGNFGLQFTSQKLIGQVYGQPLYLSLGTLNGLPGSFGDNQPHAAVYVLTQSCHTYAFDASNLTSLWSDDLLAPSSLPGGDTNASPEVAPSGDIDPVTGATETPVIDPVTGTLYALCAYQEPNASVSGSIAYFQRLYALDVKTGAIKNSVSIDAQSGQAQFATGLTGQVLANATTDICNGQSAGNVCDSVTAQDPTKIPFSPLREHERAGMMLFGGRVYLTYGSHSDQAPYFGEILGYNASTLALEQTFIASPNAGASGLWMSGASPAVDQSRNLLIFSTANGALDVPGAIFDQGNASNPNANPNFPDFGESVLEIPTNTTASTDGSPVPMPLSGTDSTHFWAPFYANDLNHDFVSGSNDTDLGSGGVLLVPPPAGLTQWPGPHPNLMIVGGKAGTLYLLDRDNPGGVDTPVNPGDPTTDLQGQNSHTVAEVQDDFGNQIDTTPAYFSGNIYYAPSGGNLEQRQIQFNSSTQTYTLPRVSKSSLNAPNKGYLAFISANGNDITNHTGIVWVSGSSNALTAYDAQNVASPIFNTNNLSVPNVSNPPTCETPKFSGPIEKNGMVYLSCYNDKAHTEGYLFAFGAKPTAAGSPNPPSNVTAVANSSRQISLSWVPSTSGNLATSFNIYRATDNNGNLSTVTKGTGPGLLATGIADNFFVDVDEQLQPGTEYCYEVTGVNNAGESNFSAQVCATTVNPPSQPGLVAYWDMEPRSKVSVTTNQGVTTANVVQDQNTVFDATGNGHNGTVVGEAKPFGTGFSGDAELLHGTETAAFIQVPDSSALDFKVNQSFTLDAWIQPTDVNTGTLQAVIAKSHDLGGQYGIAIDSNNHWIALGGVTGGAQSNLVSSISAQEKIWTNVTLIQDATAGTRTLYVNGQVAATGPALDASGSGQLWMGAENEAPGETSNQDFQGILDEVRIYNIALTPGQVAQTFAPSLVDAVSNQTQGAQGTIGITLYPVPAPQTVVTEPRAGTVPGTYNIAVRFGSAVQSGFTVCLTQPVNTCSGSGSIGESASLDPNDPSIVDVTLTNVPNGPVNIHLANLISAEAASSGAIAGAVDVPFDVLVGDVTGDHVVDNADVAGANANATPQVTPPTSTSSTIIKANYIYDINCDGAVNQADINLINGQLGNSLVDPTLAPLARFKTAIDSLPENNGSPSNPAGRVPALAFDNDPSDNSRWDTNEAGTQALTPGIDPTWLMVDLNGTAAINQLQIKWNAAAADYTLWVHPDNGTGAPPSLPTDPTAAQLTSAVLTAAGWAPMLSSDVTNTQGAVTNTFTSFQNSTGRYVLMVGNSRETAFGYSIDDFQIFGTLNSAAGSTPTVPQAPTNLQITAVTGQITLNWAASSGATSYNVFRGTTTGGETLLSTASGTSFTDSSVVSGTKYFYFVEAVNSAGSSVPSTEVSATVPLPALPSVPTGLTATPATGQITLNWTASTGATSYQVLRGTTSGGETPLQTTTGTTFTDTTVVSGTTYFYEVEAVNVAGNSTPSNEVSATSGVAVTIPAAPTNLTASLVNGTPSLTWNLSSGATSYNVFRSATSGGESSTTPIATGVTSVPFSDSTAAAGTTVFYTVVAGNSAGSSAMSNEASVTVPATTMQPIFMIDSGSSTAVAGFSADEFFNAGTASGTNATITIPTTLTNAAPAAVYQTNRFGTFTYTIPVQPGNTYTVLLDFSENFWTQSGKRQFNITINGNRVRTNFDIVGTTGGQNIADVETFNGITPDSNGNITISFTNGAADQAEVSGVRILSSGTMPPPATPVSLFATPGNNQVALTWSQGVGANGSYSVFRGTSPGAEGSTPIVSGITITSFIDTTAVNGTTYFYTVTASNSGGQSAPSTEVNATPGVAPTGTPLVQISAGNTAAATPFVADEFFTGGGNSGTGNSVNVNAVVSPAPTAVYQHERSGGSFSYTINTPTPGGTYLVRLHFNEFFWTKAGQRVFNVQINNQQVLKNFDIIETAGANNTAVVEQFQATSDSSGNITITFSPGIADQPKVSGIEVFQQ